LPTSTENACGPLPGTNHDPAKGKLWIKFSCRKTSFSITENQTLTTGTASRPVRANRGGRLAQLMETSKLLGQGLGKKLAITTAGSKRPRNQLNNASDDLPDNMMAPPLRAKRQCVNKVFL
jgi:hypothetical protein